jgi:hypothetical protein
MYFDVSESYIASAPSHSTSQLHVSPMHLAEQSSSPVALTYYITSKVIHFLNILNVISCSISRMNQIY